MDNHLAQGYQLTNEKLTLLHNVTAFHTLEESSYELDRELQRLIGKRAADFYEYAISLQNDCLVYGEGANLMDKWGYKVVTDGSDSVPFIEDHYTLYNVSFDEFSERIHSIFTDNCLTSTDYAIKFKNYNGRVAVHFSLHNEMVAGMTIYVQEQYPDTYRLVKNTPEKVEFTLISHYDRDGSVENPLEVYIIEYPIRMVKTDYGWRIDDFHTSRYG